jgi:hypothetical protein
MNGVSVTVDLPGEVLARLRAEAARRGVSIDEVVADLAGQLPGKAAAARRTPVFVGAGASGAGITPRIVQSLADGFGRD